MHLTVDKDDGEVVSLDCEGTIREQDVQAAAHPLEHLLGPNVYSRKVLFNLELTTYVDSSGVGWMIGCHKRCLQAGGMFVLHSIPPSVSQILRVLRLDSLLFIAPDEAQARARLQQQAK